MLLGITGLSSVALASTALIFSPLQPMEPQNCVVDALGVKVCLPAGDAKDPTPTTTATPTPTPSPTVTDTTETPAPVPSATPPANVEPANPAPIAVPSVAPVTPEPVAAQLPETHQSAVPAPTIAPTQTPSLKPSMTSSQTAAATTTVAPATAQNTVSATPLPKLVMPSHKASEQPIEAIPVIEKSEVNIGFLVGGSVLVVTSMVLIWIALVTMPRKMNPRHGRRSASRA